MNWSVRQAAAVEARGTSFDMHTNIKARPGSQGTLFQGGKPVAQHRWPRGYSPTRMAQVGGALMLGGGGMSVRADRDAAVDPEYPGIYHAHLNPHSDEHTKRLMLEPIARSTAPASLMTSLAGGIHLRVHGGTTLGEAAHYEPTSRTINVNRQPWVTARDEHDRIARTDATLIHEVGHHADITANGVAYDAMARTHPQGFEGIRGLLEHNADAFMLEHFRNDPRNQRRSGFDARTQTYGGRGVMPGVGYDDPGAETREQRRSRSLDEKVARHKQKTGEVWLNAQQFPAGRQVQGVLF